MKNRASIRIGLVFASDFKGYPPGGAHATIEIFLKGTHARPFDIHLFGFTTSAKERVGHTYSREIYGRKYPFTPLFGLDAKRYKDRKPAIPIRVQAFIAYALKRSLISSFNFDLLYLHGPETIPLLVPKREPVLYHLHGPEEKAAEYSRYGIFQTRAFASVYSKAIKTILDKADQFIVIDPETYNAYTERVPHKKDCFHLFPTAIDVDQFRPIEPFDNGAARAKFGLPKQGKLVLYVGRLSWRKGVDLLIKAFFRVRSMVPDANLAIAGTGEDREAIEALVRDLNLVSSVFFLGQILHLPSPDLPVLFNAADVSVVSSIQESLALVISEALACGTPVVSTPVGIAPEVIQDGITGYLVHSREPAEMAHRITDVIRDGKFESKQCVAAAQRYSETSIPICDVIEQLYFGNAPNIPMRAAHKVGGQGAV